MKNSIPVRDRASGQQSSCKLGIKDHSIHRNSPHRNAMLCVEFGWMLACTPVFEQVRDRNENWRPSRRKRWVGCGDGRCAHRRMNHTRAKNHTRACRISVFCGVLRLSNVALVKRGGRCAECRSGAVHTSRDRWRRRTIGCSSPETRRTKPSTHRPANRPAK